MEIRGISVTLAKINTSSVHKQLLRVKEDEVRLPAEMFAGKWKESLQDGSSQVGADEGAFLGKLSYLVITLLSFYHSTSG